MDCAQEILIRNRGTTVKNHSEKLGGSLFYVFLSLWVSFWVFVVAVVVCFVFVVVLFFWVFTLSNVLCLYHFAVVLVYCNKKFYAY